MNKFLKSLEITFRRDPTNFRCVALVALFLCASRLSSPSVVLIEALTRARSPRINKAGSILDTEQKSAGKYFFVRRALSLLSTPLVLAFALSNRS